MIVRKQKPITFDNKAGAIFSTDALIDAVIWYTHTYFERKPVAAVKRVFMHGKYPAVSVHGKKLHIHRLLFTVFKRGLQSNEYVHHKDGNKLNARLNNLELISASKHQKMTNKGRKQSPDHVAKRTAAMKRTRYENPELLKA